MPFKSGSFDVVLCCDVLEHVQDLPKVISEVSRVLKAGGLFVYDTFNRTAFSKISAIKILQDWRRWAIMPPGLHVWDMFIKPAEIRSLLSQNNLAWLEHKGIEPDVSYPKMLRYLRKRAKGEMTFEEFSNKIRMAESSSTRVMYLGSAVKTSDHQII
jgi:2-polyprenyl-6-hydroxyphenyl methylase/3-demethylubiquinone-9 3-methyltransferase